MFQKVSTSQLFLFEIWGKQAFLIPAPGAFHKSKDVWKAKGKIGDREFEVLLDESHIGKDNMGKEIPISVADKMSFEMSFEQNDQKDSLSGTIKFL